ncbi:hypothetical protein BC827DRAFT_663063 [Russula dissimulans]|nr:hypothetical protein BC827DRAFT_663063 [Russula dissimulans]
MRHPHPHHRRPGSLSSGSVGGAESAGGGSGASQRSRSNSLGPCEVLTPVTEHGELGHEDLSLLSFLILSTNLSPWSNWYKDLATLPPSQPSTLYETFWNIPESRLVGNKCEPASTALKKPIEAMGIIQDSRSRRVEELNICHRVSITQWDTQS